ncbi:MAG: addiction module antitoxin [bacterium]|nr:addiction module antitoxin [bacterium]
MSTATKKLTVLVEADVYRALQRRVGRGNIGRFLSDVARPHLISSTTLRDGYAQMAADRAREREAQQWSEGVLRDIYDTKAR